MQTNENICVSGLDGYQEWGIFVFLKDSTFKKENLDDFSTSSIKLLLR